jgi:hypothetical protein
LTGIEKPLNLISSNKAAHHPYYYKKKVRYLVKCKNYEDGRCKYYVALIGTNEELPTGMDPTGVCDVTLDMEDIEDWIDAESEDCDMLDMEN